MGHIKHHAIVLTSFSLDHIKEVHTVALSYCFSVSDISISKINSYASFCIFPDGSKEGWTESDKGDELRKQFTDYLTANKDRLHVDFVEIIYGGDDYFSEIVTSS